MKKLLILLLISVVSCCQASDSNVQSTSVTGCTHEIIKLDPIGNVHMFKFTWENHEYLLTRVAGETKSVIHYPNCSTCEDRRSKPSSLINLSGYSKPIPTDDFGIDWDF